MPNNTNQNETETKNVSDQKQEDSKQPEMEQIFKEELEQLRALVPAVKQLQKDNEALLAVADRAKLKVFNERQQVPGNRTVKLLIPTCASE